jgi:hypothetical protein
MEFIFCSTDGTVRGEGDMSFIGGLGKVAAGAAAGVLAVTALPVFGAVGAITATGMAVGSLVGAAAGVADELLGEPKEQ